jgi:hypothetical protein
MWELTYKRKGLEENWKRAEPSRQWRRGRQGVSSSLNRHGIRATAAAGGGGMKAAEAPAEEEKEKEAV